MDSIDEVLRIKLRFKHECTVCVDRFPATVFVTQSLTLKTLTVSPPLVSSAWWWIAVAPIPWWWLACILVVVSMRQNINLAQSEVQTRMHQSTTSHCLLDIFPTTRISARFCGTRYDIERKFLHTHRVSGESAMRSYSLCALRVHPPIHLEGLQTTSYPS